MQDHHHLMKVIVEVPNVVHTPKKKGYCNDIFICFK